MRLSTKESVRIPMGGKSVIGICRAVLSYMDTQDTSYPSQYTMTMDEHNVIITRTYEKQYDA